MSNYIAQALEKELDGYRAANHEQAARIETLRRAVEAIRLGPIEYCAYARTRYNVPTATLRQDQVLAELCEHVLSDIANIPNANLG